ncbi:MAG: family 20 glycosylhydrolase [Tannerella sp.]|jgi:hexosaminidase|nr:family 20 glycosylhydrolase [Tannerella sp.]
MLYSCTIQPEPANEYSIIPRPKSLTAMEGRFKLKDGQVLSVPAGNPEAEKIAAGFIHRIKTASGITISTTDDAPSLHPAILFEPAEDMGGEAYRLSVTPEQVRIRAAHPAGFFYAVQSLYQLLPPEIVSLQPAAGNVSWSIPCVEIDDEPRFAFRSALLDVGRHFMPKAYVLEFLDRMAAQKMNQFHFHPTEDQGWRIEIKKYPRLTEVGSVRPWTQAGFKTAHAPVVPDGVEHSGFYTQEDIKEIVAYAAERYINVLPEIELPGHSAAAVAAYPEYACGVQDRYEVIKTPGVFKEVYCPKEATFRFLEDVFDEVLPLFPGKYVHIGGDECPKDAWKKCPHCQALIRKLNLKDEYGLQSYFIRRMEQYLNGKGKQIIGWDEILEGGLAPHATVMSWRGEKGGIEAAKAGHPVVMIPNGDTYLNYYQEDPEYAMVGSGSFLSMEQVYRYEPVPAALTPEERKCVLGTGIALWTPYMKTPQVVDYYMYPRFFAIAEVAWTPQEGKDYDDFLARVGNQYRRLDIRHVNACRNYFDVYIDGKYSIERKRYEVSLVKMLPGAGVRYTTDGSEPDARSSLYTEPVVIAKNTHIKAAVFVDGKPAGKISEKHFYISKATGKKYYSNARYRFAPTNPGARDFMKLNFSGLTNGIKGYLTHTHPWVAYHPVEETQIVVDLEEATPVGYVKYSVMNGYGTEAVAPQEAVVEVSTDSIRFTKVAEKSYRYDIENRWQMFDHTFTFTPQSARFVRIRLKNGRLPHGLGGVPVPVEREGELGMVFIDEIEIE